MDDLLEIAEEYIRLYEVYRDRGEDISHNDQLLLYVEFLDRVRNLKKSM